MKVLWFTNTPSLYDQGKHNYYGGGWIESLEEIVRDCSEIELAISFFHPTDNITVIRDRVIYHPIKRERGRKNPIRTILNNWRGTIDNQEYSRVFMKIIDDFKPDVIHVFGTEGPFALIQDLTNVPVLAHLQGLINPIVNAYFPVGNSRLDFLFSRYYLFKNFIGSSPVFGLKRFHAQARREKQIFRKLKYVCGRTDWDQRMAKLFNPNLEYFHIDEVLRPVFYERASEKRKNDRPQFTILSTLSPTSYKGIDVVLKSAKQLSDLTDFEFEWRVIGIDESLDLLKLFEQKENVSYQSVNIKLLGKMNPSQIVDEMLVTDVFVHPSYIDNSPNSVCEAQILGLPVIACHVGGVDSLITHNVTGVLVPSNGVFEIVYYLKLFKKNPNLKIIIGQKAKEIAQTRHHRGRILKELILVYKQIN